MLRRKGLGRRAVADAADLRHNLIKDIRDGTKLRIRARAERRILAVTPEMIADRALVSAKQLWKRVDQLLEEGYTKTYLAQQLHYKNPALQFKKERVTARNRENVERLYRRLTT